MIDAIDTPQFAAAAIHETTIRDGIARMSPVDRLVIPAGEAIHLEEGGHHLMLMSPRAELGDGSRVSLTLHYGDDGLLIVDALLRSRVAGGESR